MIIRSVKFRQRPLRGSRARFCAGLLSVLMLIDAAWGHGSASGFGVQAHPKPGPVAKSEAPPSAAPQNTRPAPTVAVAGDSLFQTVPAVFASHSRSLRTFGHVVPDFQAVIDINAYNSGEVRRVMVLPGQRVKAGDPIISLYSPEFIATEKGHLALLKNEQKLSNLREEGRLPDYLKDAKENLKWWGMTERQISDLVTHGKLVEEIVLRAPTNGVVTDVYVQPGSLVNAGDKTMQAFVVMGKSVAKMIAADRPYWIEGFVYPNEQALLREGAAATLRLGDGRMIKQRIKEILPLMDQGKQTARFLIALDRPVSGLVLGQAVDLDVAVENRLSVWIPRQAVAGQKLTPTVFVAIQPGRFERRNVRVRTEAGELLEVTGMKAGEHVAVSGKMLLEGLFRLAGNAPARVDRHDH